jgi:hypothetical protein
MKILAGKFGESTWKEYVQMHQQQKRARQVAMQPPAQNYIQ